MAPFVGEGTLILSLLNGITSEDELAAAFGREKVPYAMILGIDAVREGNSTSFSAAGKIHFGDARNRRGRLERARVAHRVVLRQAGVGYVVPEDMVRSLWYKFMINVGINQASAVLRAPYGAFQRLPEAKEAMEGAMRELIAISRAKGTGLAEADLESWYGTLLGLSPDAKTSMLQDVEAGRKTEVEAFAGTVIALGEGTGVPTPVNRLFFNLIRTIEQTLLSRAIIGHGALDPLVRPRDLRPRAPLRPHRPIRGAAGPTRASRPSGEKILLYCKPTPDYLPSPLSCLVHGITPQYAARGGALRLRVREGPARRDERPGHDDARASTPSSSTTSSCGTSCIAISSIPTSASGATATAAGTSST